MAPSIRLLPASPRPLLPPSPHARRPPPAPTGAHRGQAGHKVVSRRRHTAVPGCKAGAATAGRASSCCACALATAGFLRQLGLVHLVELLNHLAGHLGAPRKVGCHHLCVQGMGERAGACAVSRLYFAWARRGGRAGRPIQQFAYDAALSQ